MKILNAQITGRRQSEISWEVNNPILLCGERILVVTTDGRLRAKVGDGINPYSELPFEDDYLLDVINESEKANDLKLEEVFEKVAVESKRIDNIVSVSNQPTQGNTELADIRIGYDGLVHESAGAAVRALGKELQDVLKEVQSYINKKAIDGLHYENNKLYLTSNGMIVSDPVDIVSGVEGIVTSVLKLTNLNDSSIIAAAAGSSVLLKFRFTSTEDDIPTGNGVCKLTVNGSVKTNFSIRQGESQLEVSNYLISGENNVVVTCTDSFGNYRSLSYTITVIDLSITSTFDDTVSYAGDILYKYTAYGLIDKTVHFIVDGEEFDAVVMSTSGKQNTKTLPAMSHGIHTLKVYVTAEKDGMDLESSPLIYDIMCVEENATAPMIASPYVPRLIKQGELVSIPYSVLDPTRLACDIILRIECNEEVFSEQPLTVDRLRYVWNTRRYPVGDVTFSIVYGDLVKSHKVQVSESDIKVSAVSNDLELYLTSAGRSNSEPNPGVWEYKEVSTTFENFNWKSTGWCEDSNGDTVLRVSGDAKAHINFKPFDKDLKAFGKTIEMEFLVHDVNNREAIVISCMSGDKGLNVTADMALLKANLTSMDYMYKDETKIRLSFVIESTSEYRLMMIYLNGYLSGVKQYPVNEDFQQIDPVSITVGSPYCGVDIYTLRCYNTALTSQDIVNNYIADTSDIVAKAQLYEDNNVFDNNHNISYDKIKSRIPTMIIIGDLPKAKEDNEGNTIKMDVLVKYTNPGNPDLDFEDTAVISVQGTSSQWYVRKNWKLKCSAEHLHSEGKIPTRVFCMKADYAEATSTHNTQNANFVETLYDGKTPAQIKDPRCRTTIYGFPCVIFHQRTENDPLEFQGKYNFNYDKGSEEAFGFTGDFDVESWEFCNNTSDACLFKGEIPESWGDDFEARYPDGYKDISRFKVMHDWVVSTNQDAATGNELQVPYTDVDGITHTHDTAEYRLAKFKTEFEDHFDMHYATIYYVYTTVALMVDQRAKNMFLTYWADTGKWQPWFYDNDTSFGINNEGQLVFDYYHEDTDTVDGANVYNGQNSTLWVNYRMAFESYAKAAYQELRNKKRLTSDLLKEYFITNGSNKWSASIYNADSEFKYISMLKSDGDASNLSQVRGSGEEHFKYFIENRLNYLDSKWFAQDYADDYVSFRIYTPATWTGIEPNADITVKAFSNMYAGVRYKANGTLQQDRVVENEEITFEAPDETFNDTETAVFGASQLSSVGDLSPLYCGSINLSKATKLVDIKVGDSTEGYTNPFMKELSVGANKLLRKIDIQNCPNLTDPLALSLCPNIEEIYAKGSGITGIDLVDGGYLKTLQLPRTIADLTVKNHPYITDFSVEGYENLKTLKLEGCPNIDPWYIFDNAPNLERVRVTNIDITVDTAESLINFINRNIKGFDENGLNIDKAHIDGKCHIKTLLGSEMKLINEAFPYLKVTYDNLTSTLTFMTWDGQTILATQTITNGGNGIQPTLDASVKSRESTAQYTFTYSNGWSTVIDADEADLNALIKIEADRTLYMAFNKTLRYYDVKFYTETTLLETQSIGYGHTAYYSGGEPVKTGVTNPYDWEFIGWSPSPVNITGETSCYAQYEFVGSYARALVQRTLEGYYENDRVTSVGDNAFRGCKSITGLKFGVATSVGGSIVYDTTNITKITFIQPLELGWDVQEFWHSSCHNNTIFDFYDNVKFRYRNIQCPKAVILRYTGGVCEMEHPQGIIMHNSFGYIYVPRVLVTYYTTSTQWSNLADRFRVLEDYTVDGTVTGELDETKI